MKIANFTFFVASLICLTNAAQAADHTLTFGVIAKSNNNPVFQLNNTGVVAVLAGNPNAPNLQRRIVGLREEAPNYPDLKILDTFYHKETPQDALATVEHLLLAQQVYEWGVRPVDLLFDAVEIGKYPESWFVKISLLPVTKENVEDLSKHWTGWLQGQSN